MADTLNRPKTIEAYFAVRELEKRTRGNEWKEAVAYQPAVEAFIAEARKAGLELVDVPDEKAPDLTPAEPVEAAFPPEAAVVHMYLEPFARRMVSGNASHFFVQPSFRGPSRFCTSPDGKEIVCSALALPTGLRVYQPSILESEDGAQPMLMFPGNGPASAGVFRASDGVRLIDDGDYKVDGGYTRKDGSSILLLQHAEGSELRMVARFAPQATKPVIETIVASGWNQKDDSIALLGTHALWITSKSELRARHLAGPRAKDPDTVMTLPGPVAHDFRASSTFIACLTKRQLFVGVRYLGDETHSMVVMSATDTAFGKPFITHGGHLVCTDDAAVVLGFDAFTRCTDAGCETTKIESPSLRDETASIGDVLVRASVVASLLRITWEKDGKTFVSKLYDGQFQGTAQGGHWLGSLKLTSRRDHALAFLSIGDTEHVVRVDATGNLTPVVIRR